MIRKSFRPVPGTYKVLDATEGIVEAIVNCTAIDDLQRDIMEPGCWGDVIKSAQAGEVDYPSLCWGHDWAFTTGKVLDMEELHPGAPGLNEKLAKAGAGALKIRAQYNLETQRGREAFSDVQFGAIKQWSVGFVAAEGATRYDNKGFRHISKVAEFPEVSNVLVGASPGTHTTATKADTPKGDDAKVDCPTCDGKGKIMGGKRDCPDCSGDGKVTPDKADKLGKSAETILRVQAIVDGVKKAVWSTAFQNSLPDSSFAFIESGGEKDEEGKTKPRSKRHFPFRDENGKPDEAHVRNALARIPQSTLPDAAKNSALGKVTAAAKKLGIEVSDDGKAAPDDVEHKDGAVPVLTGDEAQHNGPLADALAALDALITQEIGESEYGKYGDAIRLACIADDLQRWALCEASEDAIGVDSYAMPSPVWLDATRAGLEMFRKEAEAVEPPPPAPKRQITIDPARLDMIIEDAVKNASRPRVVATPVREDVNEEDVLASLSKLSVSRSG